MKSIIGILAGICFLLGKAFLVMKTWSWFIATQFDIRVLGYVESLGIILMLGAIFVSIKQRDILEDELDWEDVAKVSMAKIMAPWVFLIFSYIYYIIFI